MVKELRHIDITDNPELVDLVDQVQRDNEPVVLRKESEDVAIVRPMKRASKRRVRGETTSADDPFWDIIGMGRGPDDGIHDVSSNKHKYLADAYAPRPTRE